MVQAREFLVFLSWSKPMRGGLKVGTFCQTVTAAPGSTRAGLLRWALDQLPPEARGCSITAFSVEPNELFDTAGTGAAS